MVYAIPALAQVGITEAQAREQEMDIEVRAGDMSDWFSTRHVAGDTAFYKTVLEKQNGRILGATILGPHAEEQINVLALAIRLGVEARRAADTLFAYPTGSSDIEHLM
jgi:glutathione reductase (NADPH)